MSSPDLCWCGWSCERLVRGRGQQLPMIFFYYFWLGCNLGSWSDPYGVSNAATTLMVVMWRFWGDVGCESYYYLFFWLEFGRNLLL